MRNTLSNINVNEQLREHIDSCGLQYCAEFNNTGWWHSIDLGNGVVTPGVRKLEELRGNYARFLLPEDLTGKRVLDIGCWDGFYSFEAERRGAEVVAIDRWRSEKFFEAHAQLNSRVQFQKLSVYEVTPERLGKFDIVFFLGVLYHLRHPLLALEKVCSVTREVAIIESQVIDEVIPVAAPLMEFYEMDELAGQYDNWWRPNSQCLMQMARAAGFVNVEMLNLNPAHVTLKASRQWSENPASFVETLRILGIGNAITYDQIFPNRGYAAWVQIWVQGLPATRGRDDMRVTIGGSGSRATSVEHRAAEQISIINAPLPAGLPVSAVEVQLFCAQQKSNIVTIELCAGDEWSCA